MALAARERRAWALRTQLLAVIGRWKIIDNLRRSLIKPAILLWLVAAWSILPGSPTSWTVLILLIFAGPVYLDYATELLIQLRKNRQAALRANVWALVKISTGAAMSSTMYPGSSGLLDERRHHAHVLSPLYIAEAPAGLGHGRADPAGKYLERAAVHTLHVAGVRNGVGWPRAPGHQRSASAYPRRSASRRVVRFITAVRLLDEPPHSNGGRRAR